MTEQKRAEERMTEEKFLELGDTPLTIEGPQEHVLAPLRIYREAKRARASETRLQEENKRLREVLVKLDQHIDFSTEFECCDNLGLTNHTCCKCAVCFEDPSGVNEAFAAARAALKESGT